MLSSHALCARHADAVATFSCERCGTFGCEACRSPQRASLCTACAERGPIPLEVLPTIEHAYRLVRARPRALLAVVGLSVAFGLANAPASLRFESLMQQMGTEQVEPSDFFARAASPWAALMGLSFLYWVVIQTVLIRVFGDEASGLSRRGGELAGAAARRFPAMVAMTIAETLAVYLGFALCIVPGVFLSVAFALAAPAVVLGSAGPFASMGQAWNLSRGTRLRLAGALAIGIAALVGFSLVGALAVLLLRRVGTAGYYLGTALSSALYVPGMAFLIAVLVAAWYQRTGQPRTAR